MNLLPIGQLDGGHILYSIVGGRHKLLSRAFAVLLLPMYFFWVGWLVLGIVLLLLPFFLRHPAVYDPTELGAGRTKLASLALIIFLLSFTLAPL
jgi:Zn-dependent protease